MSLTFDIKESNNEQKAYNSQIPQPKKPQQQIKRKQTTQQTLIRISKVIQTTKNIEQLSSSIKEYCVLIVLSNQEEMFINFFVEFKFLQILYKKIKQFKYSSELLKAIFSLFQFLIQALKRDQDLIYFLVKINQEGYISSSYIFQEEEDIAYYANFLKLMIRMVNEKNKFLAVFFNHKQPHFPLLLKLLKFYNCSDTVMHTSSKLAIMEVSSNSNPLVQKYILNFPFIIFYPCYIGQVLQSFKKAVSEDKNMLHIQDLQNHLKFLQEYIMNKDRATIDMYTNNFLYTIGKYIYGQVASLNEKTIKKVKKMYKIILNHLIPQISVIKIKLGLLCIFNSDISHKMKGCFEMKEKQLQTEYWIIDECQKQIVSHCRKIFYSNQSVRQSFFKTINSYIPRSKDNWFYHQIKKISEMIGFAVNINEEINYDKYNIDSYLNALQHLSDDKYQINSLTQNVIKIQDQELLYLHLKLINALFSSQQHQVIFNIEYFIPSIISCCSLSLIQIFYNFIVQHKILQEQSQYISNSYNAVLQKLIFFIFNKGMKQFLIRIKDSRLQQNQRQFFQDIYRQIQCEILLFVALRTLLGFSNQSGTIFDVKKWNNEANKTVQTTFKCNGFCQSGPQLFVIIQAQYLKIKNKNQQHIHKEELFLSNIQFYEQKEGLVLIGNEQVNNYSTTLFFPSQLQPFFLKQIAFRKQLCSKIGLILKQMQFQFSY